MGSGKLPRRFSIKLVSTQEIFGKKADNNKLYSKSIEISSYGLCSLRNDRGYYTALEKGNMLKGFRGVSLQRRNVLGRTTWGRMMLNSRVELEGSNFGLQYQFLLHKTPKACIPTQIAC